MPLGTESRPPLGCLVGWLVGWLAGWLVGWLVGRWVGWVAGWLVGTAGANLVSFARHQAGGIFCAAAAVGLFPGCFSWKCMRAP